MLQPKLHVDRLGSGGPPIVFLHGVGGTSCYWASRVVPLADRYLLVLVDLLGFRQSPKPWLAPYTVERHVEALHRAIGSLIGLILAGHSFGSIVTVAYPARHPDRVDALVLLSLPDFGGEERALKHVRGHSGPDR